MVRPVSFTIFINFGCLYLKFKIFGYFERNFKFGEATRIWFRRSFQRWYRWFELLYFHKNERAIFFDERLKLNYHYSFLSNT